MEAKQSRNNDLPNEVVAKIIAMMPFPSIFKARMLSKTWLARLSPIKLLDDEKEQGQRATRSQATVVTALQKEVGAAAFQEEVSANWPIFFPCRFSTSHSSGYDLANQTLRSFPLLSFLPESIWEDCGFITAAGALLVFVSNLNFKLPKLYVVNIFTRSWKVLPPCPPPKVPTSRLIQRPIVTNPSMQNYRVIMLFKECMGRGIFDQCYAKTYDSKSNAWSSKKLVRAPFLHNFWCMVHLTGVLYWMEGDRTLFALDCEEGTITQLPLSGQLDGIIYTSRELVVCNSSLVIVLTVNVDCAFTHKLMKIDIESGRMWEIGIGCPHFGGRRLSWSETPVGYGDCIYVSFLEPYCGGLTYNLPKDQWSRWDISPNLSFPNGFWDDSRMWNSLVVEPGLNLFMPV